MTQLASIVQLRRYVTVAIVLASIGAIAAGIAALPRPPRAAEVDGRITCVELAAPIYPKPVVEIHTTVLPRACVQYGRVLEAFARCPALPPESQDALRRGWESTQQAWQEIPPGAMPTLEEACAAGRDAMNKAAAQLCPEALQY